jgi:predicted esterase
VALATSGFAQALPNLSSVRVRYNTQKATVKPDGELKAEIDAIDKAIAEAGRQGQTGELRRLYAKGMALLARRAWTDVEEFQSSLVLRTGTVVLDSLQPAAIRLEQIFAPGVALSQPLNAVATIRPQGAGATPQPAAPPAAPGAAVGSFDQIPRDLRESPFHMDLDLSKVADGAHVLELALKDGERAMGTVSLRLFLQKGLDARLRALAAVQAPADVQASLRYPADYIRKINRGLVELGGFNVATELAAAESVAAAVKSGKHPFTGRTGGFERHYVLDAANEVMPYRIFVPTGYNGTRPYPLIVALHGLGANEDSFMDSYARTVPTLAEQRGYIVVAPLGFRVDGFYGFSVFSDASAADRRRLDLSERDVMEVLSRVRKDYRIDDSRIYLMGHSMGAIGTWAIGAKYPEIWAALAPFSGLGNPATIERMKHIPQIVVHGDADPTVNVSGSRNMVAAMKTHGVDHIYVEVPGGNHVDMVVPNLPAVFDFFDKKRKAVSATQHRD